MRTIHEIREALGKTGASIIDSHHEATASIAAVPEPDKGRYLDRLPFAERRRGIMREPKTERARESHGAASAAYAAETERYHEELSGRVDYLRGRLFKVEDAGALSRGTLTTDAKLGAMLELTTVAGNAELGWAVYVASEQREFGEIRDDYPNIGSYDLKELDQGCLPTKMPRGRGVCT